MNALKKSKPRLVIKMYPKWPLLEELTVIRALVDATVLAGAG
jgi:hypothetical protein